MKWTESEDQTLKSLQFTKSYQEIGQLLGRTTSSVRNRCYVLGITGKRRDLTADDLAVISEWYSARENKFQDELKLDDLAKLLGRTKNLVSRAAKQMGLTKQNRKQSPLSKQRVSKRQKDYLETHPHPRGMLGKPQTDFAKQQVSKASKERWTSKTPLEREIQRVKRNVTMLEKYGTTNVMLNQSNPYSRTKSGKRADLDNMFFRSAWEANYARYLNFLKQQGEIEAWEYEPKTFVFEGETRGGITYLPDFKVVYRDGSHEWHEVKGWMDAKSKSKLKKMARFYPNEIVIVIGADEYRAIAKWSGLIEGWE